jgi:hypothetical protein
MIILAELEILATDGNVFWTVDGKIINTATFQSLKGFSGSHQICSSVFSSDIHKLKFCNYALKKVEHAAYIDIRRYRLQTYDFGCNVTLLEPNKLNLLAPLFATWKVVDLS